MEILEKSPLPPICQECIAKQKEIGELDDCYNCDNALDRWYLAPEDEASLQKTIEQRKKRGVK